MTAFHESTELAVARAAFDPARFGFTAFGQGWRRDDPVLGPVVISKLGWEHAQAPAYDVVDGQRIELDALSLVVRLQARTWGMPPEELVPVNLLAVLNDTGGALLVAYRLEAGFNADGWLGFAIGAGASSGSLVSHMLGVREELRGALSVGWWLKVIQAHAALASGHRAMTWTFDPMRGANARLNLEKLGATVGELTVDKYGPLRSELYGDAPSDRFAAHWDLLDPGVHARVAAVARGDYRSPTLAEIAAIPELTAASNAELRVARTPQLCLRIPGDIDALTRRDPAVAIAWRMEVRAALAGMLTTNARALGDAASVGPVGVEVTTHEGPYRITGFATGSGSDGERESWYVLSR